MSLDMISTQKQDDMTNIIILNQNFGFIGISIFIINRLALRNVIKNYT